MKKAKLLIPALAMSMALVPATAFAAPVEIDYWSVFTGGDGAVMQGMVDKFNESQDEVHVNHTPMTADDLYQKIPLSVQTGSDIPDVAVVHIERIPNFVANDMLYSYDEEILSEAGISAGDYIESAFVASNIDEEQYGIPLDVHSYVTYYNKDLFDQYGLNEFVEDGVLTFDDIRALGDKAREQGFEGDVFDLGWMRAQLLCFYAQLDPELTLSEDGETPCINNENMKKVFETVKSLYEDGYTSAKDADAAAEFYGGEMLVWMEGIWMKAAVVDAGINFGMLPAVAYDPAVIKNWTSSHNFVQFADEERTEEEDLAVAKFVKFMGEQNSETWAKDAGQCPAYLAAWDNLDLDQLPQGFLAKPENVDTLAIYSYDYWGLFDTAFSRVGWDFVDGTIGIDEALAQIDAEITDAIAAQ